MFGKLRAVKYMNIYKNTERLNQKEDWGEKGPNINARERHRQKMFCFNEVTAHI